MFDLVAQFFHYYHSTLAKKTNKTKPKPKPPSSNLKLNPSDSDPEVRGRAIESQSCFYWQGYLLLFKVQVLIKSTNIRSSTSAAFAEGSACAVVFDCKFIETSASLHHNVQDLFEGIVRQIRLRKDSKEDNARRMANCRRRESISKKAKRFLGRMVARKNKKMAFRQKSKSCHDLTVL